MPYHPHIRTEKDLRRAIQGLIDLNCALPSIPNPLTSGWVYKQEPGRLNEFQTVTDLIRSKQGDCEDLVAAYVAYLLRRGIPATFDIEHQGGNLYHVVVYAKMGGRWRRLDPSLALGMGK